MQTLTLTYLDFIYTTLQDISEIQGLETNSQRPFPSVKLREEINRNLGYTLVMDSSIPLVHHDPDRSWITDLDLQSWTKWMKN